MQKNVIMKLLAGIAVCTFFMGQIPAGFAQDCTLGIWSRQGYAGFRSEVAGKAEPGAIGRGKPLIRLAQGELPERITSSDSEYVVSAKEKILEAIEIAVALAVKNAENVPAVHAKRAAGTVTHLIDLYQNLDNELYLFKAAGKFDGAGHYLFAFSTPEFKGVAIELVHRLYAISPVRLAHYLYHMATPEEGLVPSVAHDGKQLGAYLEDHRTVYREIQTPIFGEREVAALGKNLRDFIYDMQYPIAAPEGLEVNEVEALYHMAALLGQRLSEEITVAGMRQFFHTHHDLNEALHLYARDVVRHRIRDTGGLERPAESAAYLSERREEVARAIDAARADARITGPESRMLHTILSIYSSIIRTNKFSPLHTSDDTVAFSIDGRMLAELRGTITGFEKEVTALTVDDIADLLEEGNSGKAIETLGKVNPDHDLLHINYFYDAANAAQYIAAVFKDMRNPEVTTTLGGFRYTYGTMLEKDHHWDTLQREAEGLAASMQSKYLAAGLLREGVKWKGIGAEHLKRTVLARVARAAAEIGLPSIANAGPDMNVDPVTIGVIVANMQEAYRKILAYELLALRDAKGYEFTAGSIDDYENRLAQIGSENGVTFLFNDLELRDMREEALSAIREDTGEVTFESTGVTFSNSMIERFNKILSAMVAGGEWEAGRLPLPDIAPTGFGLAYGFLQAEEYLRRTNVVDARTGKVINENTPKGDISIRNPGAGDVGGAQAYFAALLGYRVVSISDVHGTVYCEKGFSREILRSLFLKPPAERNVTIDLRDEADTVSDNCEDIWDFPATITAPAAIAYQIKDENVEKVAGSTNLIMEGANISFDGVEDVLHRSGVPAVVGWTVNSGGITCCEYEFLLLHMLTPGEIAADKKGIRTAMLEEMYKDIAYKVTSMSRVILALQERNANLNPTQIAGLVVLAIKNKKAEIYTSLRRVREGGDTAAISGKDNAYYAAVQETQERFDAQGSHMTSLKVQAIAVTQLAYDEVIAEFAERLQLGEMKRPDGEPELLKEIRGHMGEVGATFPMVPEQKQIHTKKARSEDFLPDDTIRFQAEVFKSDLLRKLAHYPDKGFVAAFDTDLGGVDQGSHLMAVRKAMRDIAAIMPNLILVEGSGSNGELIQRLDGIMRDEKTNIKAENIFIVSCNANVRGNQFINLHGRAWIAAIDDTSLTDAYLPVFEMLTLQIMGFLGADANSIKRLYDSIAETPVSAEELARMLQEKIIYITPRAVPLSGELKKTYERVITIYQAA